MSGILEGTASTAFGPSFFHLCLSVLSKKKAWSPDKFMDVTIDVKVTDEDDFLSRA